MPDDPIAALPSAENIYGPTDYGAALAWARDLCVQSSYAARRSTC